MSLITLGGNYGWRVMEGTRCNIASDALPCNSPAFTPPALEYTHSAGRCSVTGGYVYRGSAGTLPDGTYVYGDFCTGEIFGADVGDLPLDSGDLPIAPTLHRDTAILLSSFGVAVDYTVGPGTATPGTEFRAETGTLTFAPGVTRRTIYVSTKGDQMDEPDETFLIALSNPIHATISVPQATGTILDDDPPPCTRSTP